MPLGRLEGTPLGSVQPEGTDHGCDVLGAGLVAAGRGAVAAAPGGGGAGDTGGP